MDLIVLDWLPNHRLKICEVFGVAPSEVVMVTANANFGDIETATALGMQAILIRNPKNIIDLAGEL